MKKNHNNRCLLDLLLSLILLITLSCQSFNTQDKKKLVNYYKESQNYQLSLKTETILKSEEKIRLFKNHVQIEYKDFQGELIMKSYVRDSSYFDVGIYSYRPNRNHISFEKFFFNYVDTVIFVQKYDTLKWNNQIEHFNTQYKNQLSKSNKMLLIEQKIK